MKALILTEYNHFDYTDAPVPACGPTDALVAVKACGICGSDVHGMDGSTGRRRPPIIMGHEAAGVIVEVGSDVRGWHAGDRVTFDSTIFCGVCGYCIRGHVNLCDNRQVMGVSCADYRRDGAFAEYVSVPARTLFRLPDNVSFSHAAMAEAVSVAAHAASRVPLHSGETALVIGAGMIGLLVIQVLAQSGRRIVAADLEATRLELARAFGAHETVCMRDGRAAERLRDSIGAQGADVAFEVVGAESTIQLALEMLRKGGTAVLVGNVSPSVAMPLQAVVTRELALLGSCASAGEYPRVLDWLASGAIRVTPLISAVAPLSEGADWFGRLHAKDPSLLKVILTPAAEESVS